MSAEGEIRPQLGRLGGLPCGVAPERGCPSYCRRPQNRTIPHLPVPEIAAHPKPHTNHRSCLDISGRRPAWAGNGHQSCAFPRYSAPSGVVCAPTGQDMVDQERMDYTNVEWMPYNLIKSPTVKRNVCGIGHAICNRKLELAVLHKMTQIVIQE